MLNPKHLLLTSWNATMRMLRAILPSLADPLLPMKLREGCEQDINYCTTCDNCLELLIQQAPIGCATFNMNYLDVLVQTRQEKGRLTQDHT